MRHAKAETFAEEDHRRRLTDRGLRAAGAAGRWLAEEGLVPTHAFVSTAARTRETWAALATASGCTVTPHYDDGLYVAGPDAVVDILRTAPEAARVVLYLGHNPTAATLPTLLDDGTADPVAFRSISEGFPTAALAVLDVPVAWPDLGAGCARLVSVHKVDG